MFTCVCVSVCRVFSKYRNLCYFVNYYCRIIDIVIGTSKSSVYVPKCV